MGRGSIVMIVLTAVVMAVCLFAAGLSYFFNFLPLAASRPLVITALISGTVMWALLAFWYLAIMYGDEHVIIADAPVLLVTCSFCSVAGFWGVVFLAPNVSQFWQVVYWVMAVGGLLATAVSIYRSGMSFGSS